ncbi:MAG: tetratricopeptide repeat protein [Anaerolineae bacterium]|nr:tetratricopeptide repeat protein [Anaerolineae bacterium]
MSNSKKNIIKSKIETRKKDLFFGREREISYISRWLYGHDRGGVLQVVGQGGTGKTSLVREVINTPEFSLDKKFEGRVVWVDCADIQNRILEGIFTSIRQQLKIQTFDNKSKIVEQINSYIQDNPSILIFDSFETLENNDAIISFISHISRRAKIIIIARQMFKEFHRSSDTIVIELSSFSFQEASELIRKRIPELSREEGEQIIKLTSGHPLALGLVIDLLHQGGSINDILKTNYPRDRVLGTVIERFLRTLGESEIWQREIIIAASFFNGPSQMVNWAIVADLNYSELPIDVLKSQSYITQASSGYVLHDAIKFSILQQVSPEKSEIYEKRFTDLYKSMTKTKDQTLLENEWSNITKAIEVAFKNKQFTIAWDIVTNVKEFIFASNYIKEYLYWADTAIEAAEKKGDKLTLAYLIDDRSEGYLYSGRYEEALIDLKSIVNGNELSNYLPIRLSALIKIGEIYLAQKQLEESLGIFESALGIARNVESKTSEVSILINTALIYSQLGVKQKSLIFLDQAIFLAEGIGDRLSVANALGQKAKIVEKTDPYNAIEIYQRILIIHDELGNKAGRMRALRNLGDLYMSLEKLENAEEIYLDLLRVDSVLGAKSYLAPVLNALAEIRMLSRDFSASIDYAQNALRLAREHGDLRHEVNSLLVIADNQRELGNFKIAAETYEKVLKLNSRIKAKNSTTSIYLKLGEVYESIFQNESEFGTFDKALQYYQTAQFEAEKTKDIDISEITKVQLSGLFIKAYQKSNNQDYYKKALEILKTIKTEKEFIQILCRESYGKAYFSHYLQVKEKTELEKAREYLQNAFDFALSQDNLPKWLDLLPVLSKIYFEQAQAVNWEKIWELGTKAIKELARSKDATYTDRVASTIAESVQIASKKGDSNFAIQQLIEITEYFQNSELETPDAIQQALNNLRRDLGEEKFTLLYASAKGKLTSNIASMLEESRTLMGNQQFEFAARKLSDALNLLVNDGSENYKRQRATILFLRGLCLREQQLWEISLQDQEQAFNLYVELKDMAGQAHVLLEIGFLYEFMNSYDDARIHYMDAYRLYKKSRDKKGLANAVEHLGVLEFRVRMYVQAIENLEEAQKLYIELGEGSKASSLEADITDARTGLKNQSGNLEE